MTVVQTPLRVLQVGMVGMGMIFEETYAPVFERLRRSPLYNRDMGPIAVHLAGIASRTGQRAQRYCSSIPAGGQSITQFHGLDAAERLVKLPLHAVCVATPDTRHHCPALAALNAQKHVLIEKPSVLSLQELDELNAAAREHKVLAKVVYHKLFDPDHKRLRTLVEDGVLRHVNHGYCSLLEPKQIAQGQFAEWIAGRNPATYVGVHYFKLIDYSLFGGNAHSLDWIQCAGQRGILGTANDSPWDSVQTRIAYRNGASRTAAFDVHTSWVNPDNFPGYVEQEVQFRFDNGVWNASQRKRGVEVTIEGTEPASFKTTPNHHYNARSLEPWNERVQRGYGLEAIERFFHEAAYVEFGGADQERDRRLEEMRALTYNDLSADRNVVAVVQAQEALLAHQAAKLTPGGVQVNSAWGGLVLWEAGAPKPDVLYQPRV